MIVFHFQHTLEIYINGFALWRLQRHSSYIVATLIFFPEQTMNDAKTCRESLLFILKKINPTHPIGMAGFLNKHSIACQATEYSFSASKHGHALRTLGPSW